MSDQPNDDGVGLSSDSGSYTAGSGSDTASSSSAIPSTSASTTDLPAGQPQQSAAPAPTQPPPAASGAPPAPIRAHHVLVAAPVRRDQIAAMHAHAHAHAHAHSHAPPPHLPNHGHAHSHAPPPQQPQPPPQQPAQRPILAHRQRTLRVPVQQAAMPAGQNSNQLGAVRDRLFQAMLVRMALWYTARVNRTFRKAIEITAVALAVISFLCLVIIHGMFARVGTTCMKEEEATWPREGIVRVEVVRNLAMLRRKEQQYEEYRRQYTEERAARPPPVCTFDPKEVLQRGPVVMPAEIREHGYLARPPLLFKSDKRAKASILGTVIGYIYPEIFEEEKGEEFEPIPMDEEDELAMQFDSEFNSFYEPSELPYYEYRVEYSLIYGLLRLPARFIDKHNISLMVKQIDADDACLGSNTARWMMANVVSYEDPVLHTLKGLAVNESDIGYVHDLRSNDHYHFVQLSTSKMSYVTAAVVMLLFTFAISLLLRFSHHQIFLFIVDLLHMFEHNQPLAFPAAPLLTVILALVGMEAIMSEVFNDTTTAFYVILIVWLADQFDAICCQSPTSKRYWLRFFFLYQFLFYSYQYRFGGVYGGVALLTSSLFILHSMIYFFHHYEIPLILYTDRLQRIMTELNGRVTEPPIVQEVNLASGPNENQEGGESGQQPAAAAAAAAQGAAAAAAAPQPPAADAAPAAGAAAEFGQAESLSALRERQLPPGIGPPQEMIPIDGVPIERREGEEGREEGEEGGESSGGRIRFRLRGPLERRALGLNPQPEDNVLPPFDPAAPLGQ